MTESKLVMYCHLNCIQSLDYSFLTIIAHVAQINLSRSQSLNNGKQCVPLPKPSNCSTTSTILSSLGSHGNVNLFSSKHREADNKWPTPIVIGGRGSRICLHPCCVHEKSRTAVFISVDVRDNRPRSEFERKDRIMWKTSLGKIARSPLGSVNRLA